MSDDNEQNNETEQQPYDDGKFPAEYVQKLREEAADRRTKAKEADDRAAEATSKLEAMSKRVTELETTDAVRDLLAEPGDLLLRTKVEDLVDDDGNVDRDKARAAAEALVKDRPELAKRKVTGDAGQGPRGATMPEPYDFSERLRAAAG